METAGISDIQKELKELSTKELVSICIRLGKYKNENKELLSYLLFKSSNEAAFIKTIKEETEIEFKDVNRTNMYQAKKTIRKILRKVNKYSKISGQSTTELELRIHYCSVLKSSGIPFQKSAVLQNLYVNQLKKIESILGKLHEDLQFDYVEPVEALRK